MPFRCYGSLCFNRLIPSPPTIPLQPLRLFSNRSPLKPCGTITISRSLKRLARLTVTSANPRVLYLLTRCRNPALSILAHMDDQDDQDEVYGLSSVTRLSMLALASVIVGHQCTFRIWTTAPPGGFSFSTIVVTTRPHFTESSHSLDPGRGSEPSRFRRHGPRRTGNSRLDGHMEGFRICRGSDGSTQAACGGTQAAWGLEMASAPRAICLFVFKPNHPEVYSAPTARHKCCQTLSERQRSSRLLHSLERPPQIDVSRSLAYASHVLENA
ncbi:hypothetical protein BKA70DRAFT_59464 [Coprinopsis sp. MPI-PUGE-AT-0042]|nr:hypothetical protein BKA70DRAFT_59464 [Coprinopsis sp. MPI-PUGE-AT-0042]